MKIRAKAADKNRSIKLPTYLIFIYEFQDIEELIFEMFFKRVKIYLAEIALRV